MKYASLDLETTGLLTSVDQILEIGCVIDDLDEPQNPNPPTFHAYLKHDRIWGNPYALVLNADIIKIIAENKHPDLYLPKDAAEALQAFMYKHCGPKPTAAGKNFQGFDKPFIEHAFPTVNFNFHHRCFDATTSFYQKGDKQLPDLKLCLARAKIELPFKLHTAVDDAKAVIALLRHIHPLGQ